MGYNADLYDNYTSASWHPNGLVGLSVLVQIGQMSNIELRKITDAAASVPYRGKHIGSFNVTYAYSVGLRATTTNLSQARPNVLPQNFLTDCFLYLRAY